MNISVGHPPFVWHEDKRDGVWKYGSSNNGMGVFLELDSKWYGNVVLPGEGSIYGLGPYETIEEAMAECEVWYLRIEAVLEKESL